MNDDGGLLMPFTLEELHTAAAVAASPVGPTQQRYVGADGKVRNLVAEFSQGTLSVNEYRELAGLPLLDGPAGEARERRA